MISQKIIESDINLFADDTSLLEIVTDPVVSANKLNSDLDKLQHWASKWLFTFNPEKTEVVTFSCKLNKPVHPTLYLAGTALKEVQQHEHLGLTFSADLNWKNHIRSIVSKASQRVAIMKRLKFTLSRSTLERLYKTIIRPVLEYSCVIVDACTTADCESIESVQYEAARICTGALWNTNKVTLLREMGWETLATRRKYHKLMLLFKIKNEMVPPYLANMSLPLVSSVQSYSLRNANHIRTPRVNTARYRSAFYPSSISLWNQLPNSLRSIALLQPFKSALAQHFFPSRPPVFWRAGERMSAIHHTRLRMGHSTLNAHLASHGIGESHTCQCGFPMEDVHHFFFICPKFAAYRPPLIAALAEAIASISLRADVLVQGPRAKVNLLLNGSPLLSFNENLSLVKSVQLFIFRSRRFI